MKHTQGNKQALDLRNVLVIGTQTASPYGIGCAKRIATRITERGWATTAGLGYGIDGAAHAAALDAGGITVACLPHGIDRREAWQNAELGRRILNNNGCFVSETTGTQSTHGNNRPNRDDYKAYCVLQAKIARLCIIVECPEHDGTHWTADACRERNIPIGVIVFPAKYGMPAGNAKLIRQGATPIATADDLQNFLDLIKDEGEKVKQPTPPTVPAQEVNNITEVKGDLFADKQAAILHGVNCKGVAGRGFVLALKQAYPTALVKYTAYGKAGQLQPGGLVVYERKSEPLILHAATQDGYGAGQRNAKAKWIESALELAIVELDKRGITQLAMPRIASGLGGMDWGSEIKPIIVRVFAEWRGHVTIYSL